LRPDTRRVDGCDFCEDRLADGKNPFCVDACTGNALIFGDLADPESDISRLVKETKAKPILTKYKTKPNVYYSGLNQAVNSSLELAMGVKPTDNP
jgi:Fe-S-cluster-containing dehydrogenase component